MTPVTPQRQAEIRHRQQLTNEIRRLLRNLRIQLALLNHQVGTQVDLRDGDLDCLDLIMLDGPLSPTALARRAGLHPATITGILDRLERGGWVARERDPSDRRAVLIQALNDRNADLMRLYSPMSNAMNKICAGYNDTELELIADFLRHTANAGATATDNLLED
jgi:DNA-binding MarR family transcriptional regulator